jgi:hypothetical protein
MKNFLFIFLLMCQITIAQTDVVLNSGDSPDNIVSRNEQLTILPSQLVTSDSRNMSLANNVYIVQIGNYNKITSTTRSRNSNINLYQRGNNNNVLLNVAARTINESVIQRGMNNSFINLNLNKVYSNRTKAIQIGRNQKLLWVGSNSISDRMMVKMKGNNQRVIIRNIKR